MNNINNKCYYLNTYVIFIFRNGKNKSILFLNKTNFKCYVVFY